MKKYLYTLLFSTALVTLLTGCAKDPEPATELALSDAAFTSVPHEGTTLTLTVTSNAKWAVSNLPTWCTANPQSGTGNATVTLTVQANDGNARQATLTVTAKELSRECSISQDAKPVGPTLAVDLTEFRGIRQAGEALTLQITANIDWTVNDLPAWCTASPQSGTGNATVTLSVSENTGNDIREATFAVSGGAFNHPILLTQLSGKMIMPDKIMRTWLSYYGYITVTDDQTGEFALTDKGRSVTTLGPDAEATYEGLEHFPNLKEIAFFGGTERMRAIQELDFRAFRTLETVTIEGAHSLHTLKMENLPNLQVVQIRNSVKENERKLVNLTIYNCPRLDTLACNGALLTTLQLTGLPRLRVLEVIGNKFTELNVSACPQLEVLRCYSNRLTAMDVSKNTRLTMLQCRDNQLATLDISKNTGLKWLSCGNNPITALDIRPLTRLENFYCEGLSITAFDLRHCPSLRYFDCSQSKIQNIDLSGKTNLFSLNCHNMPNLDTLNISGCNSLNLIGLTHDNLNGSNAFTLSLGLLNIGAYNGVTPSFKTLVADNWSILKILNSIDNQKVESLSFKNSIGLKTIIITGNTSLKTLYLQGVNPTTYNVTGCHPDFQRIDN